MPDGIIAADRISGWAKIAQYLGCDISTAIRRAKAGSLPVHQPSGRRGAVHAYRHELDTWLGGAYYSPDGLKGNGKGDSESAPNGSMMVSSLEAGAPVEREYERTIPKGRSYVNRRATRAVAVFAFALLVGVVVLRWPPASLIASNPTRITQSHTHILSPLFSDGEKIFYPRYENGRYALATVPVAGGNSADLETSITNPELCDIDPKGRRMLLRNLIHTRDELNPLYIQPERGAAQRVGSLLAYDAAWYLDGQSIIYSADGVVYLTDSAGKIRRRLFNVPGNAFWFRWAPDDKTMRFTVINKKTEELSMWEVGPNGKLPHRLLPNVGYPLCCGSWTPDGKFFLFQARVNNTFEIWAERDQHSFSFPIRSKPFPIIAGVLNYRAPLASTNGRKLFVRAEAPEGELVRYNSKLGQFIPDVSSISVRTLAYSKDQKWIAYTSLADNNLWRCRADGTQCLQLTRGFKNTIMPRWSPDERTIAFMGIGFSGAWRVYTVPATGGSVRLLSNDSHAKGYPDWSPDGMKLVFSDVPPVSQPEGIYILNLASNKISRLPGSNGYSLARWAPDGQNLVAVHAGDEYLYLFNLASEKWRPLTKTPANYPNWSHDGRYVYFLSFSKPTRAVYRVEIASRATSRFADLSDVERGPFFMGDWIGLTPDDQPLAVRNSTIEDVYAWNLSSR